MMSAHKRLADESGEGTAECAILVGALLLIAILSITVFRPMLKETWNDIASNVRSLAEQEQPCGCGEDSSRCVSPRVTEEGVA